MSQSVEIRRTYKYRLYRSKRDFRLRDTINSFSVLEKLVIEAGRSTGEIGAFDFGLKTFLVTADGHWIENPLFFQHDLPRLRQIQYTHL